MNRTRLPGVRLPAIDYGQCFKYAPAAIAVFDRQMRYLAVTDRWLKDYRLKEKDIIGKSHYDVFPEIRRMKRWLAVHRAAMRGKIISKTDDPFPRPDGTVDYVSWTVRPWRDLAGRIGGIMILTEVVTERKTAALALAARNAEMQAIFASAAAYIAKLDRRMRITYLNRAPPGHTTEEFVGKSPVPIAAREDRPKFVRALKRVLTGTPQVLEVAGPGLGRTMIPYQVSLTPIAVGGRIAGAVMIVIDISERKRAERALREAASFNQLILDNAQRGIAILDRDLRYTFWSSWLNENSELAFEQVRGRRPWEAFPQLKPYGIERLLRRALAGENVQLPEVPIQDGVWVAGTAGPMRDAQGSITGVLIVIHDITERKKLEEERKEFIASVAHQFKTPIISISGFAQMLLKRSVEPVQRQALDTIVSQSKRLTSLVDRFLAMTQLEAPGFVPVFSTFDLAPLVRDEASRQQAVAAARGILIHVHVPERVRIRADARLVESLIAELIDNAIKYSSRGEINITVRLRTKDVLVKIADQGIGLSKPQLRSLFTLFYRAEPRTGAGVGLGLTTAKRIVELHGGRIWAASKGLGKGSTFSFTLPAKHS